MNTAVMLRGAALLAGPVLIAYAADLWIIVAGLAVFALASIPRRDVLLATDNEGAESNGRSAWESRLFALAALTLGAALLTMAAGDSQLTKLSGKFASVFREWGAVQDIAGELLAGESFDNPQQAHADVIHGMSRVSLLIPGLLFLVAGTAGFLSLWPFASLHSSSGKNSTFDPVSLVAEEILLPLCGVTLMLRLFADVLYRPGAILNEPFGWAGPLSALVIANFAIGVFTLIRKQQDEEAPQLLSHLSLCGAWLAVVLLASFSAHLASAKAGLYMPQQIEWAQAQVQQVKLAVETFVLSVVGLRVIKLFFDIRRSNDPSQLAITETPDTLSPPQKAIRIAYWTAIGALPPSPIFFAGWWLCQSLEQHSALNWMTYLVYVVWAAMGMVALRRIVEVWRA